MSGARRWRAEWRLPKSIRPVVVNHGTSRRTRAILGSTPQATRDVCGVVLLPAVGTPTEKSPPGAGLALQPLVLLAPPREDSASAERDDQQHRPLLSLVQPHDASHLQQ